MNTPLDNCFDEHWIYVQRHQKNSFNIVVRALLDCRISGDTLHQALERLCQKHPYLLGKVKEDAGKAGGFRFYLEHTQEATLSSRIEHVTREAITNIFNQLSGQREHLFDLDQGELAHVHLWHDETQSLLEFSCAHLVGDVTAVLLLFKDLLFFLDEIVGGERTTINVVQRLPFDERRYGWNALSQPVTPLPLPDGAPTNPEQWQTPHFIYAKYTMPLTTFNEIKAWLKQHGSTAAVSDVFNYAASKMYRDAGEKDLRFSAVLSFRHLLSGVAEQQNINTSAVFTVIDTTDNDENIFDWFNRLHATRQAAVSPQGVMNLMTFLRNLNASLYGIDTNAGRALINAYLPINLFAFNNFNKVDSYFDHPRHFKVTDIDIQDGVPCQEARIFTFRNTLHIHPMLSPTGPFSPEVFWQKFTAALANLLTR